MNVRLLNRDISYLINVLRPLSEPEEPDTGYKPVHYRKVLRADSSASPNHGEGGGAASRHSDGDGRDHGDDDDDRQSEESYSDDQENYSDDSDHEAGAAQQEAGE